MELQRVWGLLLFPHRRIEEFEIPDFVGVMIAGWKTREWKYTI